VSALLSREGRAAPPVRLVHLGLGNFFRAHQAWYTDRAPDAAEWGIAAFTGRSADLADSLSEEEQADLRATIGTIVTGVDFRVVDPGLVPVPWDGTSRGELQVAGPWVAREYYNDPRSPDSFTPDGYLRTGDVVTVDEEGYLRIVDRTKDVVKSGGEWISSVELENEIMAHPKVAEAAVIGVSHSKWSERPLACVVIKEGEELTGAEVIEFLDGRVAKWWLPDDVVFIDEVPKTSVGKFSKKTLRDRFADYKLPTDA